MKRVFILAALGLSVVQTPRLHAQAVAAGSESSKEIDADVWAVVSATVAAGDVVGMGRTYHPDAVLVNSSTTASIRVTLVRWGEGMAKAKREGRRSTVSFRFTKRQDGSETAFESGVFQLTEIDSSGVSTSRFIPFECLLVKQNGKWVMLMERQFDDSQRMWEKLAP